MAKSKRLLPHELTSLFIDILGTSTMCKIEQCTAPELSKMKTPRDEHNKGYHRESSTEKETDKLKAIKLIVLDDTNDDDLREHASAVQLEAGMYYSRLCGGYFITQQEYEFIKSIIERFKPEISKKC